MNRIVALIHQTGLPATLERLGLPAGEAGQPSILASAVIPCRIRGGAAAGAVEPTQQSHRRALVAAEDLTDAGFPSPPILGDRLSVFGRRFIVLAVEPQMRGADAIAFSLTLQG
jgi:hypothetical protein